MKVQITLEYEEDGELPTTSLQAVLDHIAEQMPALILAENVNSTEDWALILAMTSVESDNLEVGVL